MTVGLGRVAADGGGLQVEDCGGVAVVSLCAEFVWRWTGVSGCELMFWSVPRRLFVYLTWRCPAWWGGEGVLGLGSARLQVVN
jgi:hypothetical protein